MKPSECYIKKFINSRSEKKYSSIVKAALKLFLDGAYETTSMDQIAKLAAVSKQTIYSHFGSKEALFSAVMDTQCGEANNASFESLCPKNCCTKKPRELIHNVINEYYRMMISEKSLSLFRTVIAESARNKELGKTFIKNGPEQCFSVLTEYFEREYKDGRLNIPNPLKAAKMLMFITKDYNHLMSLIDPNFKVTEKQIKEHVNDSADAFMCIYGK